jgi:hypothetical protein
LGIFYLYLLSLSQISSQPLDGQHSQPWWQLEQEQQQHQPSSTTNTGVGIVYASSYAANYATDYGKHAIGAGSAASATTPAAW